MGRDASRKASACVGSLVMVLLLFAAPPSSAGGPYDHLDPDFCTTQTIRGNYAEIERLPPLRRPPASERLSFAPETVLFQALDTFQVGKGRIGFLLRQSDGRRSEPIEITAAAKFERIDRHGNVLQTLGALHTPISSIKGYETVPLSLDVSRPGLYRANVSFEDGAGNRLGSFGAYSRVLPLVHQPPRLGLNARELNPGERLLARVENFSRNTVTYGVPYSIERWNGLTWEKAPESPDGPWIMPLYRSRPGGTGPCLPFPIPQTMPAGTYRFVKAISMKGPRRLVAEFEVAAAP